MNAIVKFLPNEEYTTRVSHQHTISRELTHKHHLENVYLTSLERISPSEFLSGAFVPQANSFINDMRSDPNDVALSIVEIGRQIGIAVCHKFLAVAHGNAFILTGIELEMLDAEHAVDWQAREILLAHTTIEDPLYLDSGELSRVCITINFYVDTRRVFRQFMQGVIHPAEFYRKLREFSRERYLAVARGVDNALIEDAGFNVAMHMPVKRSLLEPELWVANSGTKFFATLRVDRGNRFFFDHDNDHVPGMLLLEGMRQLARDICTRFTRTRKAQIHRMQVEFSSFAELDSPTALVAFITPAEDPLAPTELTVEARQAGRAAAKATFVVS